MKQYMLTVIDVKISSICRMQYKTSRTYRNMNASVLPKNISMLFTQYVIGVGPKLNQLFRTAEYI